MTENNNYSKQIFFILLFISIIVAGVILNITASFSLPVAISILLSFVFYPIVKKITEKTKLPWIFGTLTVALLVLFIIFGLSTIIGTSITTILSQYSKYESKFLSIYKIFADTFNFQYYADKSFIENMWSQLKVREFIQIYAVSFSGNLLHLTKNLGIILLFSVFLLIEMNNGHERIELITQGKNSPKIQLLIHKIISETVRYISIKFFISLATGILVLLLLLPIKIDFAIMWAFIAFIMNFIPTFGSIISVGLTTLFALIQFHPNVFPIVYTLVGMTIINVILGNIIEPRIEGKNLGLSPFVILVSLTFWGWMWGFIGMIIAVPLMVIVKIICENVSYLNQFAIMIGNKSKNDK